MPMTHYRRMADQQATAALEEFLTERAPALEALHAAHGRHGPGGGPGCHHGIADAAVGVDH